jgi:hypothetical protein
MIGRPALRHRRKECPRCGRSHVCEELAAILPPRGNYAYDVIVKVGLSRYRDHRQDAEILADIADEFALVIPAGSINALANSFLDSVQAVHLGHTDALRQYLTANGGYVMHLDGTCEAGTKTLFLALDGMTGTVLAGTEMRSENEHDIRAVVDDCVARFGLPLAVVKDLSPNIARAVAHLPSSVKRLVCHYHFLEVVGKKLLQPPHTALLKALRAAKLCAQMHSLRSDRVQCVTRRGTPPDCRAVDLFEDPDGLIASDPLAARQMLAYAALRWFEDHAHDLSGESFPFDLPALAKHRRAAQLHQWLSKALEDAEMQLAQRHTLQTVVDKLRTVLDAPEVRQAAARLEQAQATFTELRTTLSFSRDDRKPLRRTRPPDTTDSHPEAIRRNLTKLRRSLIKRIESNTDPGRAQDARIVLGHLDKYEDQLHGHVIRIPGRRDPVVVERTNVPAEHFFSRTKHGWRRRAATKALKRRLQAARPEEFLVENLKLDPYVSLCYGGTTETMSETFARHAERAAEIRRQRNAKRNADTMHIPKAVLRTKGFFNQMTDVLSKLAAALP